MTIKTVCKLTLKRDERFNSYIDYEVYPLASLFANSRNEAMESYIKEMIRPSIKVQECAIVGTTFANNDTLEFYRVRMIDRATNRTFEQDYLVLDVSFIGC